MFFRLKRVFSQSPQYFKRSNTTTTFSLLKNNKVSAKLFLGASILGGACLLWYHTKVGAVEKKKLALDPEEWRDFKLAEKKPVSHNTSIYRFDLQSPEHELALPVASFIVVQADLGEEKPVVRPYTPITYDEKGHFDLMIKTYATGKMSKHMDALKVGDFLSIKGPIKKIPVTPNMKKHIGMIAGGTGITPMLQVVHEILKNPEDKTKVTLLFSNTTEADILLRDTIDKMAREHQNFKVHYTVSQPLPGWKHNIGHVSDEMIKRLLPAPSDDTIIFVCGPQGMVETVCGPKDKYEQGPLAGQLKRLGFTESQVFKF